MIDYEAKDWLRLVFSMRGSVTPRLLPRIALAGAVGQGAAYAFLRHGVKVPTIAHSLIGVALGLLLVFRTNASYDRFWEGRKLFGAITNRCRDVARQLRAYAPSDEEREERLEIARLIGLLYATMLASVRKDRDLAQLENRLVSDERERLEPASHRPTLVATWISRRLDVLVERGVLSETRLMLLDANLTALIDAVGGAERIVKTPVPFAYAQHIKTFVLLFVFTAPFAMSEAMKEYTPIASAILAFALFGIDEIGVEIEDPFGDDPNDLPLEAIGKTLESNVRDVLAG